MDPIGERISLIISEKKISVADLSHVVGQSDKSIYNYIAGKNTPTYPVLGKIVEKYPDVNARWLLTGEGEVYISEGSGFPSVANIAVGINGPNHQVNGPSDPCAALRTEIEHLRQRLADKETIIALMQQQNPRTEAGKCLPGEE